jgi:prevent-host-death family protein
MKTANIHEAKSQLSKLIELAEGGEEVIIARAGKPVARLVPYRMKNEPRVGGQWRGRIRIARDFDEFPDELARDFGIEP